MAKTNVNQSIVQAGRSHPNYDISRMIDNPYGTGKTLNPLAIRERIYQGEMLLAADPQGRKRLQEEFGIASSDRGERMSVAAFFGSKSQYDITLISRMGWKVLEILSQYKIDDMLRHQIVSLICHFIEHAESDKAYCPNSLAPSVINVNLAINGLNTHTILVMHTKMLYEKGQPVLDAGLLQERTQALVDIPVEPGPAYEEFVDETKQESAPVAEEAIQEVSSSVEVQEPIVAVESVPTPTSTNGKKEKYDPFGVEGFYSALDKIVENHLSMGDTKRASWEDFFEQKTVSFMSELRQSAHGIVRDALDARLNTFAVNINTAIANGIDAVRKSYSDMHQEETKYRETIEGENEENEKTIARQNVRIEKLENTVLEYQNRMKEIATAMDMLRESSTTPENIETGENAQ